ncbi:MAG: hypothetical protein FJZ01_05985 [Candidatus Sericytochromatia bacterium]|nr:hypothetical protein [Candidatus Tanganyikabacteria bacterium]
MDTVTYPDDQVVARLGERFVALRLQIDKHEPVARQFNAVWTPTLLVLDGDMHVWVRTFGWYPPREFVPWLALAEGKYRLGRGQTGAAADLFDECAAQWRDSHSAAEALYWKGVALYKQGDKDGFGKAWYRLRREHPESIWTQKASFLWLGKRPTPKG